MSDLKEISNTDNSEGNSPPSSTNGQFTSNDSSNKASEIVLPIKTSNDKNEEELETVEPNETSTSR